MGATRPAEWLTLRPCARCVKHCQRRAHVDQLGRPGLDQGEQFARPLPGSAQGLQARGESRLGRCHRVATRPGVLPALNANGPVCRPSVDGASRTRTDDLLGAIQALSQLSYSPARWSFGTPPCD